MNNYSIEHSEVDILVVDDIPDNIRLLSTILIEQGYGVRKAINGPMALTAARTVLPDLILLDINMPGMDGYEVCQQLKNDAHTSSVPIIFLSALNEASDKVKAFQAGGADYISKPFQVEEVVARIQHQLTIQHLNTELQTQNIQLQKTLDELRTTQAKLIQEEKMAGLGQIVAGIAHEFNNPMSFISGNLAPACQYVQELLNLVKLYQTEYPEPPPSIHQAIRDIDLEFLLADLKKLMNSMQRGVDRIRTLVLALRIFSHLDESSIKSINIHEGIDSTLVLVQNRLEADRNRPEITLIKNYGDLPLITCYARQLNQVFFNLLNNAIDALDLAHQHGLFKSQTPTIWISTEFTDEQTIRISIKDNGIGIGDEVRSHLFEPFFTTKPVGKGAGLGLSTSYHIVVHQHKGQLMCYSELGQGAEFIAEIPIRKLHSEHVIYTPISGTPIEDPLD